MVTTGLTGRPRDEFRVRGMAARDIPAVAVIEEAVFQWDAWTPVEWNLRAASAPFQCLVAEMGDEIVGYIAYEIRKSSLQILNLAVAARWRRKGVGSILLQRVKDKLCLEKRHELSLWVGDDNLPAHLFFRSEGLWARQVKRNHFGPDGPDGYEFCYDLFYAPVLPAAGGEVAEAGVVNRLVSYREKPR